MLDPGEFRENSKMIFRGNPDLRPEYTDAIELQLQDTRKWGTLQLNPYLRYSDDAMRQIRTIDAAGVTTATFANVATVRTIGADVNANIRRGKLNLITGGGVLDYKSEGGVLSTEAFGWNARANATWTFNKTLDAQVVANYNAPREVEGGRQMSMLMTNFALRRKLWKDAGNLTLRLSDPFNTMRFRMRTSTGQVSELMQRQFGSRAFIVTFSRNFGTQLKLRPQQGPEGGLDGGAPTPP